MKPLVAYRRSRPWGWIAVGVVAILSLLDHRGAFGGRPNDRDIYHDRCVHISRVIDAVTVEIEGGARVRLCGLIAKADPTPAENFLRDFVAQPVRLLLDDRSPARQSDGSLRTYLWSDDDTRLLLNEEMIRLGFAQADRDSRYALKLRFTQHEQSALRAGNRATRG